MNKQEIETVRPVITGFVDTLTDDRANDNFQALARGFSTLPDAEISLDKLIGIYSQIDLGRKVHPLGDDGVVDIDVVSEIVGFTKQGDEIVVLVGVGGGLVVQYTAQEFTDGFAIIHGDNAKEALVEAMIRASLIGEFLSGDSDGELVEGFVNGEIEAEYLKQSEGSEVVGDFEGALFGFLAQLEADGIITKVDGESQGGVKQQTYVHAETIEDVLNSDYPIENLPELKEAIAEVKQKALNSKNPLMQSLVGGVLQSVEALTINAFNNEVDLLNGVGDDKGIFEGQTETVVPETRNKGFSECVSVNTGCQKGELLQHFLGQLLSGQAR